MVLPSKEEIDATLSSRHTKAFHDKVCKVKIGIAGLGGLGSNVAQMLTRVGISDLTIVDFDVVDLSNINRQNYYLDQIGMCKTDATEELLKRINPYAKITKHCVRLEPSNIEEIFNGCHIVCEAFDVPTEKALFINTILEKCPEIEVVSGSGMAGFGRSNDILTKKILNNLYICGDGIDMEESKTGLMSPRVNICAGHMANAVISIIMNGVA